MYWFNSRWKQTNVKPVHLFGYLKSLLSAAVATRFTYCTWRPRIKFNSYTWNRSPSRMRRTKPRTFLAFIVFHAVFVIVRNTPRWSLSNTLLTGDVILPTRLPISEHLLTCICHHPVAEHHADFYRLTKLRLSSLWFFIINFIYCSLLKFHHQIAYRGSSFSGSEIRSRWWEPGQAYIVDGNFF